MTSRAVRERADRLRDDRVPFVHARVVLAERPTSAKPGDEAIVLADGTIEGFVGGQCAVATVRSQGLAVLHSGDAMLLRIAPNPEPDQQGKTVVHNPCLSGGTLEIFMEPVLPAPLVAVLGDSPIAMAMERVGAALGYDVQPMHEVNLMTVDAVVVATHGVDEERVLVDAVKAEVPYVGLIASPKRGGAVLASLDLSEAERKSIHSPAGLNIGARTPEEVALSVFAEIIEVRTRSPKPAATMLSLPVIDEPTTAIDPICKMTVAAVESSIHADVNGERWYFCCEGCKTSFLAGV